VIDLLDAVAGADATPVGTVRVTSVPVLVARVLVPAAATLSARHPGLRLELIAEPRDLSLTRREADVALRLPGRCPDRVGPCWPSRSGGSPTRPTLPRAVLRVRRRHCPG
jgi:DNA-binding transcriptional LysR family regulator